MAETNDAFDAGRLIAWGLDAKARPAQEPEYQTLVERYWDQSEFRSLVQGVARGLGLAIKDAGEHGLVFGPEDGSVFAFRPADYRPTSSSADDRLLDGLAQIAIAATIFPRARDLDEDPAIARPPTSVDEIEETLRRICERIEEQHRGQPDPPASDEELGLFEAWRVYQRRLAAMETRDDRRSRRTTRAVIRYALEQLREFGCFLKDERNGAETYQPTYKYQVLVKELAATRAFEAVQKALLAGAQGQLGDDHG